MTAMRASNTVLERELLERAADWFIQVRSADANAEEHSAWLAWIEADPKHRLAFAQVQEAWDVAGKVATPPWPSPEELIKPIEKPLRASLRASGKSRRDLPPRVSRRWPFAAAAAVVLGVGVLLFAGLHDDAVRLLSGATGSERISTRRGEQQATVLPDGSRIELGGLTGVAVTYTANKRLIVADEGEAFYKVAHDPVRPFVVSAGPVNVKAIGTAFSVRREAESVSIVVTEGAVEVDARSHSSHANEQMPAVMRVKAGERIRFDNGTLSGVELAHTENATAWRRGRLRFENEPLRVVVASLNRYSSKQIVLADSSLEELRFTGTVFDDRTEDWLNGVQVVFPVRLRQADDDRIYIERIPVSH